MQEERGLMTFEQLIQEKPKQLLFTGAAAIMGVTTQDSCNCFAAK